MKEVSENNVHRDLDLLKRKIKMERNIDLSILRKLPELKTQAVLEIRPLAPLSMVSELPGSFYKTMKYPSKKMLCGLFENMLGWHFDNSLRLEIFKDMVKVRKKQKIDLKKEQFIQGSTYLPLLMEYFDISGNISLKEFKSMFNYSDLWNRGYRRSDSNKHLKGCRNIDVSLVAERYNLFTKWKDLSSKEAESKKDEWFKNNIGKIPCFYTSPTPREYVYLDAVMEIPISLDRLLAEQLLHKKGISNICYLGNSEGWVNVEFKKEEI